MNGFIILVFVLGGLLSARAFYVFGFEADYRDSQENHPYMDEASMLKSAEEDGYVWALVAFFTWPLAWIILGVLRFVSRPTSIERGLAKEKEQASHTRKVDAEVIRLRNWMESEKLEVPDPKTLRLIAEENVRGTSDK